MAEITGQDFQPSWISDTWLNSNHVTSLIRLITLMSTCIFTVSFANLWQLESSFWLFAIHSQLWHVLPTCHYQNYHLSWKAWARVWNSYFTNVYGSVCFKIANDVSQTIHVVVISSHSLQPSWILRPLLKITPCVFDWVRKRHSLKNGLRVAMNLQTVTVNIYLS